MTERLAEVYGIDATPALIRGIREGGATGVHLLRRNVESPGQVRELAGALRAELGPSFDVAVRHEGGSVTPFVRGVTPFPGPEALEAAANPSLARDVGRAMGAELVDMGVSVNLVEERGPMTAELAAGLRSSGVRVGPGPLLPGARRGRDDAEAAALAAAVAEGSLRVVRDPRALIPVATSRRVGLLVPRLGDVADRVPVEEELRSTAAVIRPRVGASVAVLEVAVQLDDPSIALAAEWMATQEVAVFFCFHARRFSGQRRLLEALAAGCPRRIVVTIGDSTDEAISGADASVVRAFGFQACQLTAALRAIVPPASGRGKRI